ncbi:MAG: serine acetyltransferase [Alphaproteobacteria bacterium]|nr:serine acetyltransferase [Alphaproteobacteria bacterium]MBV9904817.1 serine acetyltransferase [Alphaproteobacteria bacterium]
MQLLIRMHHLSKWAAQHSLGLLSRTIDVSIRVVYSARIPHHCTIHPTVHFSHNALAVVVTKEAIIGEGCQIGTHVVLGSNWPEPGGPILEPNVIVHTGAKIFGPVVIGKGSVVGANAVVLDDVPAGCLVAGVPATIKKQGIDARQYRADGN